MQVIENWQDNVLQDTEAGGIIESHTLFATTLKTES